MPETDAAGWPERIETVEQLDELLSEPDGGVIEALGSLDGDLMVLGVGGKMGPTLARMAVRASAAAGKQRRVIGVSRFSQPGLEARLAGWGVETIRCDLLDQRQLDALPEAPLVVAMTGMKFGSTGRESLTWAMNSYLPGMICQRFRRSRIAAFSTGNVYPLGPVVLGGAREEDAVGPVGEYAMSCLGRERIYEHFSRLLEIPLAVLRLNYACELRYGVLVDLAQQIRDGRAIDLTMGNFNVIWQGDANAMALKALARAASAPPAVFNLAGPETLSVRRVCEELAGLMGEPVSFQGSEAADALLSNGQKGWQMFGYPRVPAGRVTGWVADWIARGGVTLGKPTHFETRDGRF